MLVATRPVDFRKGMDGLEALAPIVAHDGVWLATGREIAAWYTEHYYDRFSKWLAAGTSGGRR